MTPKCGMLGLTIVAVLAVGSNCPATPGPDFVPSDYTVYSEAPEDPRDEARYGYTGFGFGVVPSLIDHTAIIDFLFTGDYWAAPLYLFIDIPCLYNYGFAVGSGVHVDLGRVCSGETCPRLGWYPSITVGSIFIPEEHRQRAGGRLDVLPRFYVKLGASCTSVPEGSQPLQFAVGTMSLVFYKAYDHSWDVACGIELVMFIRYQLR